MKIGEFFLDLFVDATKGELTVNRLIKSMGELEVVSVGQIAILTALADKLTEFTEASLHGASGFQKYAAATGASTAALQEWQAVAKHVYISEEEVASTLASVTRSLALFTVGKSGPLLNLTNFLKDVHLGQFNPNTDKDAASHLLKAIRNSRDFQALPQAKKSMVLDEAGLGSMLYVLDKGPHGVSDLQFKEYAAEAGVMTDDQIRKFSKMHSVMVSIEEVGGRIGRVVASWSVDGVTGFFTKELESLKIIAKYLEEHKTFSSFAKDSIAGPLSYSTTATVARMPFELGEFLVKLFERHAPTGPVEFPAALAGLPPFAMAAGQPVHLDYHPEINIHGTTITKGDVENIVKDSHKDLILNFTSNTQRQTR